MLSLCDNWNAGLWRRQRRVEEILLNLMEYLESDFSLVSWIWWLFSISLHLLCRRVFYGFWDQFFPDLSLHSSDLDEEDDYLS
jgi:hypothetical protein